MQKNGCPTPSLGIFFKNGRRATSPACLKNGRRALTLDILKKISGFLTET